MCLRKQNHPQRCCRSATQDTILGFYLLGLQKPGNLYASKVLSLAESRTLNYVFSRLYCCNMYDWRQRDGSEVRSAILVWSFLSCGESILEVGSGGGCAGENELNIPLLMKNQTSSWAGAVICPGHCRLNVLALTCAFCSPRLFRNKLSLV